MIELTHVSKSYTQGGTIIPVLHDISLKIADGEHVAIIGPSGSGKSTLLALMSGMDSADQGVIAINGKDISQLSEVELSHLRNTEIGIIFQSFELVPSFTALENVMLPLDIAQKDGRAIAATALSQVGLSHRGAHLPSMLSGGEEQRVAIARALAQDPKILFADEPTGNLDPTTGAQVLKLIKDAASGKTRTLVIITHDKEIARLMDRTLLINEGAVSEISL